MRALLLTALLAVTVVSSNSAPAHAECHNFDNPLFCSIGMR